MAIYCDVIEKMDIGERFEESAVQPKYEKNFGCAALFIHDNRMLAERAFYC